MAHNWEYVPQGDVEAAVIKILKDASELTGFSGGAPRISSDLAGYEAPARWIMVSREGGSLVWPKIDKPRIDINVFAESRTVAHNLAQVAQAVIFRSMDAAFPSFGIKLIGAKVETGLIRVPDYETGSPRYLFALRLTCVPYSS